MGSGLTQCFSFSLVFMKIPVVSVKMEVVSPVKFTDILEMTIEAFEE